MLHRECESAAIIDFEQVGEHDNWIADLVCMEWVGKITMWWGEKARFYPTGGSKLEGRIFCWPQNMSVGVLPDMEVVYVALLSDTAMILL